MESDHSYSLLNEIELGEGSILPCESAPVESGRLEAKETDLPPPDPPPKKELFTSPADEESQILNSKVATADHQGDYIADKSWAKNFRGNAAEVIITSHSSGEGEAPFFWEPASPPLKAFPSLNNDRVGDFINFFREDADSFFKRALGRSSTYEEMMKRIFREKNLPEELFYLALIESGYNPRAFSRAKASGIWQFIGKTAKRFGLKVDKWVDERRDPEKATHAAAEYLKSLYALFQDWDLATASYNAGEGKIMKAMKKANSQDFWKISQHRYLKKETKEYVPMFLAAVTIAQNPQKYGFRDIEYSPPLVYEKVTVPPNTSLAVIARAAESDLSEIQLLNPALKKGKTPPHSSFEVKLPPEKKEVFKNNFPKIKKLSVKQKRHHVRKGENLAKIARKYRLTIQELCDLNDISPKKRIKPGTLLLLPSV